MTRAPKSASGSGRGSPLSPLIHGRVRLLILSYLISLKEPASFTQLRQRLQLTDGTLSVHLARLEAGGMISLQKSFVEKRPQTLVRVTPAGRSRFRSYVEELKQIVPGL